MTQFIFALIVLLMTTTPAQAGKAAEKIKQLKSQKSEMSQGTESVDKEEKARRKERKADAKVAGKIEMMNKGKAGKNVQNKKEEIAEPDPQSLPEEIEKSDMEEGPGDEDLE